MVEFKDWIIIGIGGFVGIATSILSNLWHPKIIRWLDSRRLLSGEKQRAKAIQFDEHVRALHSGKRDRYLYFLSTNSMVSLATGLGVLTFITGLLSFCIALGVRVLIKHGGIEGLQSSVTAPYIPNAFLGLALIFFVLGIVCNALLLKTMDRVFQTKIALEDFPKYDAQFRERWGEPPSPESD